MNARRPAMLLLVALLLMLVPTTGQTYERATTVDLPTGERYYLYAHGGEFPTGHALEIWQETNGLADCGVSEGLPVGHATEPDGTSGLQTKSTTCNGKKYPADTKVA